MRLTLQLPSLILSVLVLLILGCTNEDDKIPLDSAVKKAYSFKPGTYWIYKDSISNRYDSFFVTTNTDVFPDRDGKYERVETWISQYSTDPGSGDTLNQLSLVLENVDQVRLLYLNQDSANGAFKYYNYGPLSYPFQAGGYHNLDTKGDTVLVALIPGISLNGSNFSNTSMLSFQNSYLRSSGFWQFRDAFYLNETEGILKISLKHIPEGIYREWSLVRWHIVH